LIEKILIMAELGGMSLNSRLPISVTRFSHADLNAHGERLRMDYVLHSLNSPCSVTPIARTNYDRFSGLS
jgi:hypothetical protein